MAAMVASGGAALKPPLRANGPQTPFYAVADATAKEGFELEIATGEEAAGYALQFWQGLDEKTRRIMLWDVEMKKRGEMLSECWRRADCVILAKISGRIAAAWASRIGPQSKCAMIHFCFEKSARSRAHEIGEKALKMLFEATAFQSFIGLIPAKFSHALRFVERLGFERGARLRGACPVYGGYGARLYDGELVFLNRKNLAGE